MESRRDEAPLAPPYSFRRPNKARARIADVRPQRTVPCSTASMSKSIAINGCRKETADSAK